MNRNPDVDVYFSDGCGRCPLGSTPQCKVHRWTDEMNLLRDILLSCGLSEERKWGVACYTHQKKNIVMLGALKGNCFISFFKGALLQDAHGILHKPGENSQMGRVIRFTQLKEIMRLKKPIKTYIQQAIAIEENGIKPTAAQATELIWPDELLQMLEQDNVFKKAFHSLTPGRQRGYVIYFSSAKQSATRITRINKYIPHILSGKGMHD